MIWLLPHPLPPLPSVSSTGDTHDGRLKKRDNLLTTGEGVGEEPNQLSAWSSVNYSILSDRSLLILPSPQTMLVFKEKKAKI
jgi:hypothetical protein